MKPLPPIYADPDLSERIRPAMYAPGDVCHFGELVPFSMVNDRSNLRSGSNYIGGHIFNSETGKGFTLYLIKVYDALIADLYIKTKLTVTDAKFKLNSRIVDDLVIERDGEYSIVRFPFDIPQGHHGCTSVGMRLRVSEDTATEDDIWIYAKAWTCLPRPLFYLSNTAYMIFTTDDEGNLMRTPETLYVPYRGKKYKSVSITLCGPIELVPHTKRSDIRTSTILCSKTLKNVD